MPKITCVYGHEQSIGTDEWIKQLSMDQLKYARDQMDALIKKAEEQPKRCIWRVSGGSGWVDGNYREEDFEKAADHLLRIFKEKFMKEAADYIAEPYGYLRFQEELPGISVERVSQLEYDTEWLPGSEQKVQG